MRAKGLALALGVVVLLPFASCGDDDEPEATTETTESSETTAAGDEPVQNACPADGCQVEIADVVPQGDELQLTFEANYAPDVARNHIHVYWDTFDANQVSDNAESVHGVEQGDWVPTDEYPEFVTEDVVSVSQRAGSTTLCVTTGDRNHNVIDVDIENCRDAADVL